MSIECLGQRLLNPFRGVMHTVRHGAAEAVTTDGLHWDIYVANHELLDGLDTVRDVGISDIRYGRWSASQGLKRGPLYPSEDFRRMEALGATVYEALTRLHQKVPFPLCDERELWLLDRLGRPLALLASAVPGERLEYKGELRWWAGYAARETFTSEAGCVSPGEGECAGDRLTRLINARAGEAPRTQWFRRNPDGSGTGLGGTLAERTLDSCCFPALFLATEGIEDGERRLIEEYHEWQAPWLLMLPHLDRATRLRLERAARRRPFLVERLCRLYPEILDDAQIQAARVEAALRRAACAAGDGGDSSGQYDPGCERTMGDDTMSTFYIELNPRGMP